MASWIDSHCHMSDLRSAPCLESWVKEAEGRGVRYFLQGGVGPEDWDRQIGLSQKFQNQIGLCFGLHPYWVADHSLEECEAAMDLLAQKLPQAVAIGEMGLDLRPHIAKDSEDRQMTIFEMQIELAEATRKPMVLHLVQAHDEAMRVFEMWGVPQSKGFVHSFNGSAAKAQDFLKLDLLISVGGPLLRPDNQKLKQAVQECPMEFLLVETDSPDQAPPSHQGKLNPLATLLEVAEEIARIKGLSAREVLDISRENLKTLWSSKKSAGKSSGEAPWT